jgi:hypothetical protein
MILIGIVIIAIAEAVCFVFFKDKMSWQKYVILLNIGFIILFGSQLIATYGTALETEYIGEYALACDYYEPWNEWHHDMCSRDIPSGTDSDGNITYTTYYYDCSHVDSHGPSYKITTNLGKNYDVDLGMYNYLTKIWKNKQYIDLGRNYYTQDGDKYTTHWNNDDHTIIPYISTQLYTNKTRHAPSVFKFYQPDTAHIKLFNYPKVINNTCPSILQEGNIMDYTQADQLLTNYNGLIGSVKQVRMWLLIFHDRPDGYAVHQESYWKGGNKNEVVVCVSINDTAKIQWAKVFSWTKRNDMKEDIQAMILAQSKFDPLTTVTNLKDIVAQKFERRQFKEFDYLTVEIEPIIQILILSLLLMVLIITIIFFTIRN